MSKLIRDTLIMSVGEFRKITGKLTDCYTDEELEQYIVQLDFLAELFVKSVKARKDANQDTQPK